ncbi:SRPBCC family protein [Singulisphaera acidiphila]|uniref:Activator of Hsp90 ATPase 1-like protein n=1 Tax=Singulisphaera acidiphila (strain ATCC BAA-1392 / DSM 18658 / VKM B-2454 / MOB10) TaxID=886293 RepID=L0DJH5_SINAD|nr:SRPBCC domain-containing protein [Singulisphaera acidiphila]AGA28978.1 Activator of Hsp90 ATPase 1-like protein [Singulisphaera acidiphila DSM 18658]
MNLDDLTLDILQEVQIKAATGDVFRSLLKRLAEENATPDDKSMAMVLEAWPGGRWFRDLGDQQGHLWGFVQVIKPPTLLEISGPMFMSYPATGHLQFRVTQVSGGTTLTMRHRVLGFIDPEHRKGVNAGWGYLLQKVKERAEA